jgi:hypothetical protein
VLTGADILYNALLTGAENNPDDDFFTSDAAEYKNNPDGVRVKKVLEEDVPVRQWEYVAREVFSEDEEEEEERNQITNDALRIRVYTPVDYMTPPCDVNSALKFSSGTEEDNYALHKGMCAIFAGLSLTPKMAVEVDVSTDDRIPEEMMEIEDLQARCDAFNKELRQATASGDRMQM